jgi:flagellar M-ring protein FliF
VPHSDAEIAEIEALVKRSVGWREERNDEFAISQLEFDTALDDQIASDLAAQQQKEQYELYIRYGVMLLALGLAAWLIRSASLRATASEDRTLLDGALRPNMVGEGQVEGQAQITAGPPAERSDELPEEDLIMIENMYTSQLSPEKKARMKAKHKMFEDLKQSILAKPDEAAELLRIWMAADNPKT